MAEAGWDYVPILTGLLSFEPPPKNSSAKIGGGETTDTLPRARLPGLCGRERLLLEALQGAQQDTGEGPATPAVREQLVAGKACADPEARSVLPGPERLHGAEPSRGPHHAALGRRYG